MQCLEVSKNHKLAIILCVAPPKKLNMDKYKNHQAVFFLSGDQDQGGSTMRVMRRQIVFFFLSLRAQRVIYTFPRGKEKVNQEIPNHSHHTSMFAFKIYQNYSSATISL